MKNKRSTHKMPDGKIMKGAKHLAHGGSAVNMDSADVPQRKRMAAGEKVTGQTMPSNKRTSS